MGGTAAITGKQAGLAAWLVGCAMMTLELTAIRVLAPHFGDSAYVWTNVIGIMLVALAMGAWLGGRWAGLPDPARRLVRALVASALLVSVIPLAIRPLGGWLLPQTLPLEAAMAALVRGSLACTVLLFAPPVLLLGVATPMLVALLARAGREAGRASGLVSAASTVGSLVGTFAATHALVPLLGSRATVWICAALLLLAAAIVRRRAGLLAAAAAAGLLPLVPLGLRRPPPPGVELVAERESAYQFLQVVRVTEAGARVTMLKINEGLDSFHSLARDDGAWTNGAYYDWHVAAAVFAADGLPGPGLRVLSLGSAAGTFTRLFGAVFPGCTVDGVEIDPAVVDLGESHFGPRGVLGTDFAGLDARVFVARSARQYDVVLVDAYARQIYIPAHVASHEFFTAVRSRLADGGVVSVNVGGLGFDDPVVVALGRTLATVFGEAHAFRVPFSRNYVLLARAARPLDRGLLARMTPADPGLAGVLARMIPAEHWRAFAPAMPVLDDDRPVLDVLQHAALRAAGGEPVALTAARGGADPDAAAELARAHLLAGRAEACLAAVADSRAVTPYLRILAGDARWALHDPQGALAEFAAAAEGVDEGLRGYLDGRRALVGGFLASVDAARATGRRNGWLGALAVLGLLALGFGLARGSG